MADSYPASMIYGLQAAQGSPADSSVSIGAGAGFFNTIAVGIILYNVRSREPSLGPWDQTDHLPATQPTGLQPSFPVTEDS